MRRIVAVALSALFLTTSALAGHATTPTFGPPVKLPGSNGGSEPGINISSNGTIFVDAPTGTPGHSALWRSLDGGATYKTVPFSSPWSRLPGGGDSDVVTRGNDLWFLDLYLGSNSVTISHDNGATWSTGSPITTLPASDRQWIALGDPDPITGMDTLYALYAQTVVAASQVMVAKSVDGGLTWPLHYPAPAIDGAHGSTGKLSAEGSNLAFAWEDGGVLSVARSADGAQTWQTTSVATGVTGVIPGFAMDGDVMAVAFTTRGDFTVKVAVSTDRGVTFGTPVAVSQPLSTNIFAWVDVRGSKVAVTWYGTNALDDKGAPKDPNFVGADATWMVRYVESTDTGATWSTQIDAAFAKTGQICTRGLSCPNVGAGDRELGDFLTPTIGVDGRTRITYGGRVPGGIKVITQN
jgi:hypothetical protein